MVVAGIEGVTTLLSRQDKGETTVSLPQDEQQVEQILERLDTLGKNLRLDNEVKG